MEYIPIEMELIPYEFTVTLGVEDFTLDIRYNEVHDFFTVDLYKDRELIVAGEKLVYGEVLFAKTYDVRTHPAPTIIPMDISGQENTVQWHNFNKTVFLYIQGEEADGE